MMERFALHYKNSSISVIRFGSGHRTALCFHGYGEDATHFEFLDQYAGNQYTFYAMDFPFHGQTEWKEGLTFSGLDLLAILEQLAAREAFAMEHLTLIGFSMGGRVALSLFAWIAETTDNLVLLAPDGLNLNFWYWASTQTWLGNRLFRFTMKHPNWFFFLFKLGNKLKMISPSIFKFAHLYLGHAEIRDELYNRWTCMRKFKPRVSRIKKLILQYQVRTELLYGQYDRIIHSSVGEKFRKGIEEQSSIHIIHSGHQLLHEKHTAEILSVLLP